MEKDWRLCGQDEYLSGAKLILCEFVPTDDSDHEHCSFCWEKFSDYAGSLHTGYCTVDGKYWICEECFRDFREQFKFKVE